MKSRVVSLLNVYWPHLVTRGWTRWEAGWSCSRCLCTLGSVSPRTGPPRPWPGSPGAWPTSASSWPWSPHSETHPCLSSGLLLGSLTATLDPASSPQLHRTQSNGLRLGGGGLSTAPPLQQCPSSITFFSQLFFVQIFARVFRRLVCNYCITRGRL